MRGQSICLPLLSDPCDRRHRRHKNVPDEARRGYALGPITADVFSRFNILAQGLWPMVEGDPQAPRLMLRSTRSCLLSDARQHLQVRLDVTFPSFSPARAETLRPARL